MTTTTFIAQLLLPLFAICTVSIIINPKRYKRVLSDLGEHAAVAFMMNMMSILGGTAIVFYHNIWTWDWKVVVTLLGWMMLLKGAIRMLLPKRAEKISEWAAKKNMVYVAAVIWAVITLILFSLTNWN